MKLSSAEELLTLLKEKNFLIGSCESLTGGLFAATLTDIPGASAVFRGAVVTYQSACKINVVHVDERIIAQEGVISEACAVDMAEKAKALLEVDICVSFTGNAGPDTMEDKPAGRVYCALSGPCATKTFMYQLDGGRTEVRIAVVEAMCEELVRYLKQL